MIALESLGWNPIWAEHFKQVAPPGTFPGRIFAEYKALYHFYAAHGEGTAQVRGRLRYEAGGRADFPAVGDWVALEQAAENQLAVIHALLPRHNRFSRKLPGNESDEQVIAANLDTLFLVTSLNRDLNPRRIERYLAAASAWQVESVVVLSKRDLCDDPEAIVTQIGERVPSIPVHALSARTGEGMDALVPYLGAGRTVALVGSSGVGKSTLLNRLLGDERLPVQEIRADDDRGRHTTTHREMLRLPQGGWLIDNPGMRELQLWDEGVALDGTFGDIAALAARCHYPDCRHEHEPRCAVKEAIADGTLEAGRLANYHKLQRELAYQASRCDAHAERERKERERRIHRAIYKDLRRRRKE